MMTTNEVQTGGPPTASGCQTDRDLLPIKINLFINSLSSLERNYHRTPLGDKC